MLRIPLLALLLVGLLVSLLAACGGSEPTAPTATSPAAVEPDGPTATPPSPTAPDEAPEPGVIELSVRDGEVSGAERRAAVALGSEVTLVVTSDVADEIHVHGYDLHEDVTAGGTTELTFTADIPGVFEVELEDAGLVLVELEVS